MKLKKPSKKFVVDTTSRVLYSVAVGAGIDYFYGGLKTFAGIFGSRATATGINSVTSGPYGWWQDKCYTFFKTTPETRKLKDVFDSKNLAHYFQNGKLYEVTNYGLRLGKQFATDMFAFNTFEPVVYGISNIVGQLVGSGDVDLNQTAEGIQFVVYISPFVAPTMRLTMQVARKLFGIKTSSELAQKNLEDVVN